MRKNERVARRWLLGASFLRQHSTRTTSAQRPAPSAPARRGILLLVVLSMLTLFLLIGTAFLVTSRQYQDANKTMGKLTETSNSTIDQGDLLNEVINQLVRDTNNQNSTLRFHSLLRDMYGNDGILAEIEDVGWADVVGGASNPTNGQVLQFEPTNNTVTDQFGVLVPQLSQLNNAYNGLVLTFLDGPARGQSVRIVGYLAATASPPAVPVPIFRVMTPRRADGSTITTPGDLDGSRILINGRPFNGTGVGYDVDAFGNMARLGETERFLDSTGSPVDRSIALMPNAAFTNVDQIIDEYFLTPTQLASGVTPEQRARIANLIGLAGLGGSDESYDAVDYQNMLLGLMPASPGETANPNDRMLVNRGTDGILGTSDDRPLVLPSLHRPALINYWNAQVANLGAEPSLLRKIMMRPSWYDHPNFTGSNPNLASFVAEFKNAIENGDDPTQPSNNLLQRMIYGPWDVDNDNDGVRDSVWVDFGAPVMENSDGRLVKPLAAILVLDMEGRLNLNAHGSEDIANPTNFGLPIAGTGGNTTNALPQGQGYGPAEVSLDPLMPGSSASEKWDWYKRLLRGVAIGEDRVANDLNPTADLSKLRFSRRRIGRLGEIFNNAYHPGRPGVDILGQLKMQGVPLRANGGGRSGVLALGNYATPPDWKGRYAVPALNDLGQPVFEARVDNQPEGSLSVDIPYEVNLSLGASRGELVDAEDGPYTVAELERVLRAYDADAGSLPSRIWEMAGEFKDNSSDTTPNLDRLNMWRATVTTDTYDLPAPGIVVPEWIRIGLPNQSNLRFSAVMNREPVGLTFADLLEYRLILGGVSRLDGDGNGIPDLTQEMRKLLPRDLADGLRLDINRPLGNGVDDDGNGVVDEPGEVGPNGEEAPYWASSDPQNSPIDSQLSDFSNDTTGKFRDEVDRDGDGLIADWERGDADGDGTLSQAELVDLHNMRRQMLAKDLYVMAMTLVDPLPATATQEDQRARARRLAQWAINVVDFRDPDNIMTAFEYDVNPFDGWVVDGNTSDVTDWVGTDTKANTNDDLGGIVWGAESPEMLITETLAWHDRRTENHGDEDPIDDEDGDGFVNQDDRGTVPRSAPPGANTKIPDKDFDQRFLPRGAGFIELYCPLPENPAANADTHLVPSPGNDMGIDLAAVDEVSNTSPCWRLMVYKTNLDGNAGPGKDPDSLEFADIPKQADRCVYFTNFDPDSRPRPTNGTGQPKEWEDDGVAFYSTLNVSPVEPGKYMVVGGGENGETRVTASLGSDLGQTRFSNIGITLDASTNSVALNGAASFSVQSDVTSVALVDQPRRFTFSEPAMGYPIRVAGSTRQPGPPNSGDIYSPILDIPLDDQRLRTGAPRGLGGGGGGAGGGLAARAKGGRLPFQDNEIRLMLPPPSAGAGGIGPPGGAVGGGIGGPDPTKAGRTVPGFSWVYLQRLANPLLPWNPEPIDANGITNTKHDATLAVNPYMTVDAMGVSVTVFNGLVPEELHLNTTGKGNLISRYTNTQAGQFFTSVERGRNNNPFEPAGNLSQMQDYVTNRSSASISTYIKDNPPASLMANLWNPESIGYTGTGIAGLARNTIRQNSGNNFRANPQCTLGFLNEPFKGNSTEPLRKPGTPFPWYTWNNRPYANANELMMVPAFRSSQLLQAFSFRTAANDEFDYDGSVQEVPVSLNETVALDGPYGHLMNFFRTANFNDTGAALSADKAGIAGMYRLLDFVHVPSPFVGTETWLNPASFGDTATAINSVTDPRYLRQPPFNKISSYREPGKMNLNTVVSGDVWDGGVLHRELFDPTQPWDPFTNNYRLPNVTANLPGHTGPLFVDTRMNPNTGMPVDGLMETRRGYRVESANPEPDNTMLVLDNHVPTFFANPFRAAEAGLLVPLLQLRRDGVDGTMLRSDKLPTITDRFRNLKQDLLAVGGGGGRGGGGSSRLPDGLRASDTPGLFVESTEEFRNSNRNPYFSYQSMTRLSSMTTNRSNVYAVWVTVGFFEVEEAPTLGEFATANGLDENVAPTQALYERVYPEGYTFGQEAGSDTGDIRRVREFVMIDRTVPVAFEPGRNHNVDKAIRLRRRIE